VNTGTVARQVENIPEDLRATIRQAAATCVNAAAPTGAREGVSMSGPRHCAECYRCDAVRVRLRALSAVVARTRNDRRDWLSLVDYGRCQSVALNSGRAETVTSGYGIRKLLRTTLSTECWTRRNLESSSSRRQRFGGLLRRALATEDAANDLS